MLLTLSFVYSYFFLMKNANTEAATKKIELFWTLLLLYVCMFIDSLFYRDFNTNTG